MNISAQCLCDALYFVAIARSCRKTDQEQANEIPIGVADAMKVDCTRMLDIYILALANDEYRTLFNSIVERTLGGPDGNQSDAPSKPQRSSLDLDRRLSDIFREGSTPFPENYEYIDDSKDDIAVFMRHLVASAMTELIEECRTQREEGADASGSAGGLPLRLTDETMRHIESLGASYAVPAQSGSHWINAAAGPRSAVRKDQQFSGKRGHVLSDCELKWRVDGEVRLSTPGRSAGRLIGVDKFVLVLPDGSVCRPLPTSTFDLAVFICPDKYRGTGPVGVFVHESVIQRN